MGVQPDHGGGPVTAQYGLHEAKAHNLLAEFADHIEFARPSDHQRVQHATAHFLGQLVEEFQQHRSDSQTAAEELVHVLDDGLNGIADAINRLADAVERPSRWRRMRRARQVPIDTDQRGDR